MAVFSIISQKGGAGKTTLTLNLAAQAERRGAVSLVIDTDPQASASQWGIWREGKAPEVIDSQPTLLASKVERAKEMGADHIFIDTPPHAEQAATAAARLADLILIPCRPSAFDLHAVQLTADLAKRVGKPAFVVFSGGAPNAPRLHEEAAEVVASYGLSVAPQIVAERADYRAAMGSGQAAYELDPKGKAASEIAQLWKWAAKAASPQAI